MDQNIFLVFSFLNLVGIQSPTRELKQGQSTIIAIKMNIKEFL